MRVTISFVACMLIATPAESVDRTGGLQEPQPDQEIIRKARELEEKEIRIRSGQESGGWRLWDLIRFRKGKVAGPPEENGSALIESGRKVFEFNNEADALLKAEILKKQGRHEEAVRILDHLVGEGKATARLFIDRAGVLTELKKHRQAADDYNKAIALGEGGFKTRYMLGAAMEKAAEKLEEEGRGNEALAMYRDAISEYKQVIWLKHDYAPAYYSLGCVYSRLGAREDALYYFRKTLEVAPGRSDLGNRARHNIRLLGGY